MFAYRERLYVEIVYGQVRFLRQKTKSGEEGLRPALESVPWQAVELEGTAAEANLTMLLKDYRERNWGRKKIPVYLLIPFRNGLIREFRLPWLPNRERDSAVLYYIRHEFPVLNEDFLFDYQITEDADKQFLDVRLTSIRQDTIKAYAKCFTQAGYDLQGIEYSVSALGEVLSSDAKVILFQAIAENRIQMVLYQYRVPQVIREFETGLPDTVKYHISLVLKAQEGPLDYVFTDGSIQADQAAALIGLPKEKFRNYTPIRSELTGNNSESGDITALALLGGMERIKAKRNYNFYKSTLRPIKVKTFLVCSVLSLTLAFALGIAVWYPSFAEYLLIEKEINSLQDQVKEIKESSNLIKWREWTAEQELAGESLEQIREAIAILDSDLTLNRLNYQQGTLTLWLECRNNALITKLIGRLIDQGWKEPMLLDYQYKNRKTAFCLSVKK